MNRLRWALVIVLLVLVGWWLLHDSPEEQVRAAHQELRQLLGKTEDDTATPSIRDVLAVQKLFAPQVVVSGDAEDLADRYSSEDIASLIIQTRAILRTIELDFSEPEITFPTRDTAVATFAASLQASYAGSDMPIDEKRDVTTQLQRLDGDWVFSAFGFEQ